MIHDGVVVCKRPVCAWYSQNRTCVVGRLWCNDVVSWLVEYNFNIRQQSTIFNSIPQTQKDGNSKQLLKSIGTGKLAIVYPNKLADGGLGVISYSYRFSEWLYFDFECWQWELGAFSGSRRRFGRVAKTTITRKSMDGEFLTIRKKCAYGMLKRAHASKHFLILSQLTQIS